MSKLFVDEIQAKTTGGNITSTALSNFPAFSAHIGSGNPGITANTYTILAANTELFDVGGCYDTSNYRFTPNVSGYYSVHVAVKLYAGNTAQFNKQVAIYKNGSNYKENLMDGYFGYSNNNHSVVTNAIVYCNGTTDYIEAYVRMGVNGNIISGGSVGNTFEAYKLIGATS